MMPRNGKSLDFCSDSLIKAKYFLNYVASRLPQLSQSKETLLVGKHRPKYVPKICLQHHLPSFCIFAGVWFWTLKTRVFQQCCSFLIGTGSLPLSTYGSTDSE